MKERLTPTIVMLISIFFYLPNNILAQSPTPNTYFNTESSFTAAPLSPNAAACGLHATIPRDLSVGLPSIDIPVCMLSDVDISVPVTLQYHPDAVKPDEHPGWVGLGWNLKAGGSIVRISKGKHDEAAGGYYLNYHNDNALNGGWLATPTLPTNTDFEDYEPDEFIFNFAGYSGKFYFNHLGEWVFTTNSGEHFEMSITDSPVNTFNLSGDDFGSSILSGTGDGFTSFTITANNGTKYTFGGTSSNSIEYTRTVEKDENGNDIYEIFPTAWHLTKIESINGNIVNLNYQRYGAIFKKSQNFNLYNQYDCNAGCGSSFTYPTNVDDCYYAFYDVHHIIYPSYLSSITGTDGNVIRFTLADSDQENYGNITVLGLSENTFSKYPKLTKITTRRDGNTEKEMELIYNDVSATANRLMLNEIYETDDSNNRLPGYQFDYNMTDLPAYHSFEVDHWGYYNGVALFSPSAAITCNNNLLTNPDEYKNSTDMLPDETFAKASILKGIIYPMGGYKEFLYGQNTSFKEVQKNYGSSSTEANYPNFAIANISGGKDVGGLRIEAINTYESPSATNPLTTKTYTYENSGILDFTSYGIEEGYYFVGIDQPRYWNIHHNNVNPLRQMSNRHICYSSVKATQADGGYRLLSYSNFDNDLSGGTTLLDEKPLAHTAQLDPATSPVSLFLRTHTAPYSSRNRERGKLLEEDIHRADGTQLRSTKNTYTTRKTETAYQVRCINRHYGSVSDVLPTARVLPSYSNARATAYYEYIYPVHLTGQEVTQYDESGANGRVTTRSFAYDYATGDGDLTDDNNLRETIITNSDNKVYKTTYTYTTDYGVNEMTTVAPNDPAAGIKHAVENNIFLPVETLRWLGDDVIGGQITTYQIIDYGNEIIDIVPYQTHRLTFPDITIPADGNLDMITDLMESEVSSGTFDMDTRYELHTTYTQYSSTGIPKQSTQDGSTPNSIILSDDELLTTASVTNAKYKDVAYTGFETYGNGNWNILTGTAIPDNPNIDNDVIFGNQAFANFSANVSSLSSGTYHISFWSNSGSGTANGTSIPILYTATNGWAYHQAEISVSGSLSFVGSGTLDELRLHPTDALMTTTTYDPVTHQTLATSDQNGKPMFYEYDDFERVIAVRDQDGNLVTDYEYKYRELPTDNVDHNSVRTHNHWVENASAGSGTNNDEFVQSTQYTDGLGRPLQSIVTAKSPQQKDIIQLREYDTDGREPNSYLPFTLSGDGNFIANATAVQQLFHSNTSGVAQTSPAYRETGFEASPINRSKVMRPEGSYQSTPLVLEYNVAIAGLPAVKDFKINNTGNVSTVSTFSLTDLNNTRQTDENGNISISYTDKLGRSILSRQQNTDSGGNTIYHDTYTVYDDFGNVRYVVSPEAVKQLDAGFGWTTNNVQDLVYEYRYDRRQRMIYKKIPAADAEEYVYDYLDRVILMQDGNRKAAGEWLFTKYDVLGRTIMTGIYSSPSNRQSLQNLATNFYTNSNNDASRLYETPTASTEGYTLTTSFPVLDLSVDDIHTINYYNNYDFNQDNVDDVTFVADNDYPLIADTRLNNMLTGTRTNILGTSTMLTTAMWYDKYGRTIQVQADNHLNGTDVSYFDYEFATNVLLKSKREHTGTDNITIAQRYEYDYARRISNVYHKIDNVPEVHLKNLQYNELGQVISSNLHGSMDDYLQSVDYRYNERGWLTRINNLNSNPVCCTQVQLKVLLEGPYNPNTGQMTTTLNTGRHILPGQTPVSNLAVPTPAGQPYKSTPWGYDGAEGTGLTDEDYSPNVTDWVLVSFRTGTAADTEIFKTAALLLKDGTVEFLDNFALPNNITSAYILVEHLNHIGVITSTPVEVSNGVMTHDFTTGSSSGQKQVAPNVWAMYAGDGFFDNNGYDINGNDKIAWGQLNGGFDQYLNADFDRNGDVNGGDKILWKSNNGIFSIISRNIYPDATQGISTQTDLFGMQIYYKQSDDRLNTTPQYNGNISHVSWKTGIGNMQDIKTYKYAYDELDRITEALYSKGANYDTDVNAYDVKGISYDLNGNIETLQRNGGMDIVIDNLTYGYDGNQLKSVSDIGGTVAGFTNGASSANEYLYDANGNMIRDDNKGITNIIYNHLNLPQRICFDANCTIYIDFLYDANGNKLRKTVNSISQDYLGGIEYNDNTIEAVYHEEGRATPTLTGWQYEYYLKDHLGNTRVIFSDTNNDDIPEILQEEGFSHKNV